MIDYELEFKEATETISVLETQISAKTAEIESLRKEYAVLLKEVYRLKTENRRIKNAIVAKYLDLDLEGEDD